MNLGNHKRTYKIPSGLKHVAAEIGARYSEGASMVALAKDYSCNAFSIFAVIKTLSIPTRAQRSPRKYDDATRSEVCRLYLAGESTKTIHKLLGVTPVTAIKIIKEAGVRIRKSFTWLRRQKAAFEAKVPAQLGKHLVYVLTDGEFIKIGYTTRGAMWNRLRMLQQGNAREFRVLHVFSGTTMLEKQMQSKFQELAHFGEWFRDDGNIAAFLASTTDGAKINDLLVPRC